MSRLVDGYEGRRVAVREAAAGAPLSVEAAPVLSVLDYWREWVGILDGEPEAEIWIVELSQGICELRHLSPEANGVWLLMRWED